MSIITSPTKLNCLNIDRIVEKCYSDNNSLIVKDLDDNVFFLYHGVYLVNGQVEYLALNALKQLFNRIINFCKWCELDGQVLKLPRKPYEILD